jgi:hypothetical protein
MPSPQTPLPNAVYRWGRGFAGAQQSGHEALYIWLPFPLSRLHKLLKCQTTCATDGEGLGVRESFYVFID